MDAREQIALSRPRHARTHSTGGGSVWRPQHRPRFRLHGPRYRHLMRRPSCLVGACILAIFTLLAIGAPLIAPCDPLALDLDDGLALPSWRHPLGTDLLGRDTLSRLLFGARVSLTAASVVALIVALIGLSVGTVAGFYGGWADEIIMRLVDTLLAFPSFILSLVVAGLLGPGLWNAILATTLVRWARTARVVRSIVLSLRDQEFVLAARSLGAGSGSIMIRHLVPNVLGPLIVLTTLDLGNVILSLAGLSFIGLGVQLPQPEWGAMLNYGRTYVQTAPLLTVFPGLAISLCVLSANLLGDGLRDFLDPRHQRLPKETAAD